MVTLKGHTDIVMGMMVMSSLDNLVSASLDTSIRVWDTYTQKPVQTLQGHNKVGLVAQKENPIGRVRKDYIYNFEWAVTFQSLDFDRFLKAYSQPTRSAPKR